VSAMKLYVLCLVLALAGCHSASEDEPTDIVPMAVTMNDDPSNQLIRLSYTNDTGSRLCAGPRAWPSKGGIIDNNGEEIFLTIGSQKYFLQREQDYCPRCSFEIAAGEHLRGVVHYEHFGLPKSEWHSPKTLSFSPRAYKCPRGLEY